VLHVQAASIIAVIDIITVIVSAAIDIAAVAATIYISSFFALGKSVIAFSCNEAAGIRLVGCRDCIWIIASAEPFRLRGRAEHPTAAARAAHVSV
jgi:hypothetical protein